MQKMMASSSELTLDCKPQSHSLLLKSFGDHQQQDQNTQRLEEFLSRLEEERLKIDAFKRELPLCMQLLTNAMETSRLQLNNYRSNQVARPVLEEFIPLKNPASDGSEKASDKANWMTSAQLWSQGGDETKPQTIITSLQEQEIGLGVGPKMDLDVTNQRNNGVGNGAFHPFSKERNQQITNPNRVLPELALVSVDKEMEDKKCFEVDNGGVRNCSTRENSGSGGGGPVDSSTGNGGAATTSTTTQNHRKARRCWSPDLHRRFVNALQMLGGSQVATPKQIRELMKVDGLTNDEVKSHLQKYRLHTRRPSPSPQAAGNQAPQLVVLGGIWVPPEYAAAAAAAHGGAPPTIYSAHPSTHPSQQYCVTPQVPQEFYAAQPPPGHQLHHQHLHHQHQQNLHRQLQLYKSSSQNQSSPESEVRVTGDRSESIEDGKSESSSWNKGDSGVENEGERERKGLVTLREEGSHGSDQITLKF